MTVPRFSIVMPAWNAAETIDEAIASVLGQSVADWELIVIDDGSADRTAEIAGDVSDPRVSVLSQPNAGLCRTRNRGRLECRADRVMFLDSDDRLRPTALARLGEALDSNPGAVLAYGEYVSMDDRGRLVNVKGQPIFSRRPSGQVLERLLQANFFMSGAALIRRQALVEAGDFDIGLRSAEDWEMWCRLALLGEFVYLGGEPVLEYRQTAVSLSNPADLEAGYRQRLDCVAAVFGNPRIRECFSARQLTRFQRHRLAGVSSFIGTKYLRRGDWQPARRHFWNAVRRRPASPREWILLGAALTRWLPYFMYRRLK